jgi:hypothetical protein
MSKSDETEKQAEALEVAAREYEKHSGPSSTIAERAVFSRDLRTAALRYARAYYAEARDLGLFPTVQDVRS